MGNLKNILSVAIAVRGRPECGLNSTPQKQRAGEVLRAGAEGLVGLLCLLTGLTQILRDRRKFYYLE